MLHSTQFPPHLAVHHKLHPDQCTDACLLSLQATTLQTAPQSAQTAQMMKTRKISRWYPWMMNTGPLKKHLTELSVSMNMDYHMDYANTHVLMRTITLFHTWTVWILNDISDYEDNMVTSSDEEIPGMEEVPY